MMWVWGVLRAFLCQKGSPRPCSRVAPSKSRGIPAFVEGYPAHQGFFSQHPGGGEGGAGPTHTPTSPPPQRQRSPAARPAHSIAQVNHRDSVYAGVQKWPFAASFQDNDLESSGRSKRGPVCPTGSASQKSPGCGGGEVGGIDYESGWGPRGTGGGGDRVAGMGHGGGGRPVCQTGVSNEGGCSSTAFGQWNDCEWVFGEAFLRGVLHRISVRTA